ncbi:MAG: signal peptide peptidase SppA [bacterium]|nr:signal peptide peptidase SppA [bacterium]
MASRPNFVWRVLRGFVHALDVARRFLLTIVFGVMLLVILFGGIWAAHTAIPAATALVVAPKGVLVEQREGSPSDRLRQIILGGGRNETLVADVIDAIDKARTDERVKVLVIRPDDLDGAALVHLREVRRAVERFRAAGKPVLALGDAFSQSQYYLATTADEIYLHDLGVVWIEGFGTFGTYFKDAIDRLEIEPNVFRVGRYKSAVEPFLRNDMSPEERGVALEFLGDLWNLWLADVTAARQLTPAELTTALNDLPARLRAAQGRPAQLALDLKLVDHVGGRDAADARLTELVGEDDKTHTWHQVDSDTYLWAAGRPDEGRPTSGPAVGVVRAVGMIVPGDQAPGRVGGDSTSALLREARFDDDVRAVVLRVDSPGGSAFASEVIRQEAMRLRDAGKPLVVSMGPVAASGGYWIATAGEEIWASPATLTGSIGIFGVFPTLEKPLARYLGMHVDGVGTTWLSGALRSDRALAPGVGDMIQQGLDAGYAEFLEHVATARKMTTRQADEVGQGRVWSGEAALRVGLVDHLGTLDDAVASAAAKAGLGERWRIVTIEQTPSLRDQLLNLLGSRVAHVWTPPATGHLVAGLRDAVGQVDLLLGRWPDPRGMWALCPTCLAEAPGASR